MDVGTLHERGLTAQVHFAASVMAMPSSFTPWLHVSIVVDKLQIEISNVNADGICHVTLRIIIDSLHGIESSNRFNFVIIAAGRSGHCMKEDLPLGSIFGFGDVDVFCVWTNGFTLASSSPTSWHAELFCELCYPLLLRFWRFVLLVTRTRIEMKRFISSWYGKRHRCVEGEETND